ncbi:MAG: hypothetical protein ACI4EA_02565 [Candidatus Ornithomonoglobus sp.]
MKEDVINVFLNPDEFGEKHVINGKTAVVIIDDDLSEDTVNINLMGEATRGNSGLYNNQKILYISTNDLPGKPKVNSYMDIDGKRHIVRTSSVQGGLFKITLEFVGGR